MKQFAVVPEIHKILRFEDFCQEFELNSKDLILTIRPIHESYLAHRTEGFHVIFPEDYALGEPTDEMIDRIVSDLSGITYNRVIAIGGGSVVDIAKLFTLKMPERSEQLYLREVPIVKEKKLIIIPTTCGTGSEVTDISIALLTRKNIKMGLADRAICADDAVMIPELLEKLPYKVFVTSSVDALIHAAESFLSPKASGYTELFSIRAMEMILQGYMDVIANGEDSFRANVETFLEASNYAGIAFGNAGCAAVHAMSYPLGGVYHVPHGEANYQFFIRVFKYYDEKNPKGKIIRIKQLFAKILDCQESEAFDQLEVLLNHMLARKPLREYGMKEAEIKGFAASVIETQQRLLGNNYVPFNEEDLANIYQSLY